MSWIADVQARIERGEQPPDWIAPVLGLASNAQALGMWWRHRQPKFRVEAHVVSFGNLTAGGTGKTPAVVERARQEIDAGRRVAVVSRGYLSGKTPEPLVLEKDSPPVGIASGFGDELAVIHLRVPEALLIKSADRVAGAAEAVRRGAQVVLLDDGFQSVRLERDEDVVLLDARHPLSNGHLLPRGLLRERPEALERATEIWLTRCDLAQDVEAAEQEVRRIVPDARIRKTSHVPDRLHNLAEDTYVPLEFLKGRRVAAACGIGDPRAFVKTLEQIGAKVETTHFAPDHHRLDLSGIPSELTVVMTEKDAVKIAAPDTRSYALGIGLADWDPA
ncbi:MAG: tetraacyldisaccharide 4'-kinase [Candidatus Hydrogenedens sp.]|nr:tetraacyldisaccharide 4'-kinase [Candidatus Hydrogenedens sp.]